MICRRGTKQPRKQEHHSGLEAMLLYGVSGQAPWYVALKSSSRNSSSPCQRCELGKSGWLSGFCCTYDSACTATQRGVVLACQHAIEKEYPSRYTNKGPP